MKEIWKDIDGYEGFYQVSNYGRVRSFKTRGISGKKKKTPAIKKDNPDKDGYPQFGLSHNGKYYSHKAHRLVAKAFIPNPENKSQVNHIDGDKTNNRSSNLEWATRSENMSHSYDNGFHVGQKGELRYNSKLTKESVLEIRNAYNLGCFTHQEIADAYSISRQLATGVINNKRWAHI